MRPSQVALPSGALSIWQPTEAAELPDDGPIEWAPVAPYWAVLWRSGVALARELDGLPLSGRRVLELGCGLGLPSLVAARAGAAVLATDVSREALELLGRNAAENGLTVECAHQDWHRPDDLLARAPFDCVLAADVLYEEDSVEALLSLLPQLACDVWLADPGRAPAAEFLRRARRDWHVSSAGRDGMEIHRLSLESGPRP